MTRYNPVIEVRKPVAADWLRAKGWEEIGPLTPHGENVWRLPGTEYAGVYIDNAVFTQMVRDTK